MALAALGGFALAGGFFAAMFVIGRGRLGFGDVKLGALSGVVLGVAGAPLFLVAGTGAGVIAALVLLLRGTGLRATFAYGPSLAAGAAFAVLWRGPVVSEEGIGMDATPTRSRYLQRALLAGGAALMALLALLATAVHAQQADSEQEAEGLAILGVTHFADGRLTVSAAAAPQGSIVDRFSAFVDNVQATIVGVDTPGRDPAAVVIAIDTSGSMTGQPIDSAKDAAQRLVARLEPDDTVAIVSFAAKPEVLSGFTTNRSATQAVLDSVSAETATAS